MKLLNILLLDAQAFSDLSLTVISSTLLILLLIAVLVIVLFINEKQRMKQEVELVQARLLFEQELRQVETEVGEQIMGQFAQELHDNIGQLLTATRIQVENQKLDHPALSESFKPTEIYLDQVTQQLRILSRTLNTDYISHIGLLASVSLEIERVGSLRRFSIRQQIPKGGSNLDKQQELMVFRIFQEIMQNALRHSKAKNVTVGIDTSDGGFELCISDDGRGFDCEKTLLSDSASGLRNILKRAKLAGLDCSIVSSEGKGCTVRLKKQVEAKP